MVLMVCYGRRREHLRAYFVQLAIISNHQNGRDTHIRQIKCYGVPGPTHGAVEYTTPDFQRFSCVR